MAKYEFNGRSYELPDDLSEEEAIAIMEADQQNSVEAPEPEEAPQEQPVPEAAPEALGGVSVMNELYAEPPDPAELDPADLEPAPMKEQYTEEDLYQDQTWIQDARLLYERENGTPFEGTDEEAANWLLWQMTDFNNNLGALAFDLNRLRSMPDDYKAAFGRAMEMYDRSNTTWNTVGRAAYSTLTDPFNVGLAVATLGTGWVAGKVAQTGTALAVKEGIKQVLRGGVVGAAVEGGITVGARNFLQQKAKQEIDPNRKFDTQEWLIDTGLGAAAGGVIGGAIGGAGYLAGRLGKTAPAEGAIPGVPPQAAAPDASAGAPAAPAAAPNAPAGAVTTPPEPKAPPVPLGSPVVDSTVPPATTLAPPPEITVRPPQAPTGTIPPVGGDGAVTIPNIEAPPGTKAPTTKEIKEGVKQVVDNPQVKTVVDSVTNSPEAARMYREVVSNIKKLADDGTFGNLPKSRDEILDMAQRVTRSIAGIRDENGNIQFNLDVATASLTPDQQHIMKVSVQRAAQVLAEVRTDLIKKVRAGDKDAQSIMDSIGPTQRALAQLDEFISSGSGKDLGSRVGGLLTGERRGMSPEDILEKSGINPKLATESQKAWAEDKFAKTVDDFYRKAESTQAVRNLNRKIQDAWAKGDIGTVISRIEEREALKSEIVRKVAPGLVSTLLDRASSVAVASVLSPATLMVNVFAPTLISLTRPLQTYALKGFSKAAFAEMGATYGAMVAAQGAAFKAARAAFRYERGLIGEDTMRLYDTEDVWGGVAGRNIRIIPRLLAATDTYMARVIYEGSVAGRAAGQAMQLGIEKGLKGDGLKKFVAKATKEASDQAFSKEVDYEKSIMMLRQRGVQRGYTGEALDQWIISELKKNADVFRETTDKVALSFTDDALFRRAFTGDNFVDRAGRGYENFVVNHPSVRLMGQLFFRTPVRVLEAGMKMTPGLNMLMSDFRDDLLGRNGTEKYFRAQGQAMLGLGLTTTTITMLATGQMTGAGPKDYKQRRNLERAGWKPYTIKLPGGYEINYRNLDPVSTPLKIMANAYEAYVMLDYRRSQGEKISESAVEQTFSFVAVAFMAWTQAVRDANLTQGLDDLLKFGETLSDPEQGLSAFEDFAGKKVGMFIPNFFTKVMQALNPTVNDPKGFTQFFEARINPSTPFVSKQYDVFGGEAVSSVGTGYLFGVDVSKTQTRMDKIGRKRADVLTYISSVEIATGRKFTLPLRHPDMPNDLRTTPSKDGTPLYDKWQQKIAQYDEWAIDILHKQLIETGGYTTGTASQDGTAADRIAEVLHAVREAAWIELQAEEAQIGAQKLFDYKKGIEDRRGQRDTMSIPFITP